MNILTLKKATQVDMYKTKNGKFMFLDKTSKSIATDLEDIELGIVTKETNRSGFFIPIIEFKREIDKHSLLKEDFNILLYKDYLLANYELFNKLSRHEISPFSDTLGHEGDYVSLFNHILKISNNMDISDMSEYEIDELLWLYKNVMIMFVLTIQYDSWKV